MMLPCCAWCGAELVGDGAFTGWQTLELLGVVVGWHRERCRALDPVFLRFLGVLEQTLRDEERTLAAWRDLLDLVVLRGPGRVAVGETPSGASGPVVLSVASAYVRTGQGLAVDRGGFPLIREPAEPAHDA